MGRPVKIHKKKSFMFTTKHNSFQAVLGIVIAVMTIAIMITMVIYSFEVAGNVDVKFGGIGFFIALLNVVGLVSGIVGLNERDAFITPAIISIVGNGLMVLFWAFLVFISW